MSRYLAGLTALTLMGAAALPLQANAAERHAGISQSSTEMSAQRHWRGGYRGGYYGYRYGGPRRYYGPRYGYYGYPAYGYPYGYYRPAPFVSFGVGPFGFRAF
jgi:hypothetical protein